MSPMPWRDKVRYVKPLAVLRILRQANGSKRDPVADVTEKIEQARAAYEAWVTACKEKKD